MASLMTNTAKSKGHSDAQAFTNILKSISQQKQSNKNHKILELSGKKKHKHTLVISLSAAEAFM